MDLNRNPIIFLKDVKYTELKALVQYMYRGEVNIAQDELPSLLNVAQSLKIRGLADVETSNNRIGSDTLILPDLNQSRVSTKPPGGTPSSSAATSSPMMPVPPPQHQSVSVQLGFQQQAHPHVSTIPQVQQTHSTVPITELRSVPSSTMTTMVTPTAPPPAKRTRLHQQQQQHLPIDPIAVVNVQSSSVQAHPIPSQMYDPLPLPTPSTSHFPAPPDRTHFTDDDMVEQTEPMFPSDEVRASYT